MEELRGGVIIMRKDGGEVIKALMSAQYMVKYEKLYPPSLPPITPPNNRARVECVWMWYYKWQNIHYRQI